MCSLVKKAGPPLQNLVDQFFNVTSSAFADPVLLSDFLCSLYRLSSKESEEILKIKLPKVTNELLAQLSNKSSSKTVNGLILRSISNIVHTILTLYEPFAEKTLKVLENVLKNQSYELGLDSLHCLTTLLISLKSSTHFIKFAVPKIFPILIEFIRENVSKEIDHHDDDDDEEFYDEDDITKELSSKALYCCKILFTTPEILPEAEQYSQKIFEVLLDKIVHSETISFEDELVKIGEIHLLVDLLVNCNILRTEKNKALALKAVSEVNIKFSNKAWENEIENALYELKSISLKKDDDDD
eukprot:TRINITY_DN8546_c0_g1_i1.p1 TRINITY_DN8546_c0_g1~~TRINITY_DN8546_c0_g1_i1.p1  ORF type:complete len:299 (+),score=43.06 TRINITY_DN8546_c0_g1_i1:54-950(+)